MARGKSHVPRICDKYITFAADNFSKPTTTMKRNYFIGLLTALAMMSMVSSCEKVVFDEDATSVDTAMGRLTVRAAEVDDGAGEDYVDYPVSVYVMDEEGKCAALQEIQSASDELGIELEEGTYDVYAVAGTDNYELPSVDDATAATVLTPNGGNGHGDLMTAHGNIVMAKGEENILTLTLQRRVMLVQGVTLTDIPDDATAVRLTISPLRKGVTLGGDYVDGTASHTFNLERQTDGSTWKTAEGAYLLEAKNNVTLKVSLTMDGTTTAYSYACGEQLQANYKVNITGNFIDDRHLTLSGMIKATDWAGTKDIEFQFDSSNIITGDSEDEQQEEALYGGAPAAGTVYKGCYVLRTENEGNSTTVTLITPTEVNKLKVSTSADEATVQQSIKDATAEALDEVAVSGVTGWRLPTQEEMEYVDSNIDAINANIEAADASITTITLKKGAYYCGYFFTTDDGDVYVYTLGGGEIDESPSSGRATYKVRGFATVTFTE